MSCFVYPTRTTAPLESLSDGNPSPTQFHISAEGTRNWAEPLRSLSQCLQGDGGRVTYEPQTYWPECLFNKNALPNP